MKVKKDTKGFFRRDGTFAWIIAIANFACLPSAIAFMGHFCESGRPSPLIFIPILVVIFIITRIIGKKMNVWDGSYCTTTGG